MKAIGFKTSLALTEKNSLLEFDIPVPVPKGHDILGIIPKCCGLSKNFG